MFFTWFLCVTCRGRSFNCSLSWAQFVLFFDFMIFPTCWIRPRQNFSEFQRTLKTKTNSNTGLERLFYIEHKSAFLYHVESWKEYLKKYSNMQLSQVYEYFVFKYFWKSIRYLWIYLNIQYSWAIDYLNIRIL
jgi:hypothetical protein